MDMYVPTTAAKIPNTVRRMSTTAQHFCSLRKSLKWIIVGKIKFTKEVADAPVMDTTLPNLGQK